MFAYRITVIAGETGKALDYKWNKRSNKIESPN